MTTNNQARPPTALAQINKNLSRFWQVCPRLFHNLVREKKSQKLSVRRAISLINKPSQYNESKASSRYTTHHCAKFLESFRRLPWILDSGGRSTKRPKAAKDYTKTSFRRKVRCPSWRRPRQRWTNKVVVQPWWNNLVQGPHDVACEAGSTLRTKYSRWVGELVTACLPRILHRGKCRRRRVHHVADTDVHEGRHHGTRKVGGQRYGQWPYPPPQTNVENSIIPTSNGCICRWNSACVSRTFATVLFVCTPHCPHDEWPK